MPPIITKCLPPPASLPTILPKILALTGLAADGGIPGGVAVRWMSVEGKRYTLLSTTNLASGFTILQTGISATPPTNIHTDEVSPARQMFYRVQVEEWRRPTGQVQVIGQSASENPRSALHETGITHDNAS